MLNKTAQSRLPEPQAKCQKVGSHKTKESHVKWFAKLQLAMLATLLITLIGNQPTQAQNAEPRWFIKGGLVGQNPQGEMVFSFASGNEEDPGFDQVALIEFDFVLETDTSVRFRTELPVVWHTGEALSESGLLTKCATVPVSGDYLMTMSAKLGNRYFAQTLTVNPPLEKVECPEQDSPNGSLEERDFAYSKVIQATAPNGILGASRYVWTTQSGKQATSFPGLDLQTQCGVATTNWVGVVAYNEALEALWEVPLTKIELRARYVPCGSFTFSYSAPELTITAIPPATSRCDAPVWSWEVTFVLKDGTLLPAPGYTYLEPGEELKLLVGGEAIGVLVQVFADGPGGTPCWDTGPQATRWTIGEGQPGGETRVYLPLVR
jgi:hypothetical protein